MSLKRKGRPLICLDGPYDERIFTYTDPLPAVLVIADTQLRYHEYLREQPIDQQLPIYRFSSTYRVRCTYTQETHDEQLPALHPQDRTASVHTVHARTR